LSIIHTSRPTTTTPSAFGIEFGLAVALLFVGGKLVAGRTFKL
jgi:hypothetical protein